VPQKNVISSDNTRDGQSAEETQAEAKARTEARANTEHASTNFTTSQSRGDTKVSRTSPACCHSRPYNAAVLTARREAYDETVLIKLEDDTKKVFTVYKHFLMETPGYFRTALESQFREASNNEFVLEDTDANTLRLFIHWLMYKTIHEAKTARAIQFCKLWVFADVRGIEQLKTDVTQAFIDRMEDRYLRWKSWRDGVAGTDELMFATRADVLNYAWGRTPSKSPLRRLLAG
jgi:hypothetical protein